MTKGRSWVVAAQVGQSTSAQRTDRSGDMEQLETLEWILDSEHETRTEAEDAARQKRDSGWSYAVMSRRDFDQVGVIRVGHAA